MIAAAEAADWQIVARDASLDIGAIGRANKLAKIVADRRRRRRDVCRKQGANDRIDEHRRRCKCQQKSKNVARGRRRSLARLIFSCR